MTTQKSTLSSSGCAMESNGLGGEWEGFYDSDEERDPPCTSDL